MAASSDYWAKRAAKLEERAAKHGDAITKRALRHYRRAAKEINEKVEAFYGRYAAEQGLTYAEAVKILRGADAKVWAKTLGEYVEEINALPDGALKNRLKAELDARAYSSRISRLDALKAQVDMEVDRLMVDLEDKMREGFGDLYTDSYYRKMFDIQQHAGKMFDFAHLNRELVENALSYPWSGADFSGRLWENKRALLFNLREIMTQSVIQGKGVAEMSKELAGKMGQSFKVAERLIRTEANHFHNAADVAAYEATGVKQYEFMATLDSRTSAVCASLDGKVFDIKDAKTGINYPPMHPWCRSTTVEYDPDEWKDWEAIGQPMPKRMTYDEWAAEQGVEPATKPAEVLNTNGKSGKIKEIESQKWAGKIKKADKEPLFRHFSEATDKELGFWQKYGSGIDGNFYQPRAGWYSPSDNTVHLDLGNVNDPRVKRIGDTVDARLFFHETGHYFDYNVFGRNQRLSATINGLSDTLKEDAVQYANSVFKSQGLPTIKSLSRFSTAQKQAIYADLVDDGDLKNAVSDLWHGLTNGRVSGRYGHFSKGYWDYPGMVEQEAVAHLFEAKMMKGERLDVFKRYFPKTYEKFEAFIDALEV